MKYRMSAKESSAIDINKLFQVKKLDEELKVANEAHSDRVNRAYNSEFFLILFF